VFPGHKRSGHLSNTAMLQVLKRLGRAGITVHGFRSTFRDWCAESTNYPANAAFITASGCQAVLSATAC